MTLRQYLIIMTLGTILCWISLGFVLMNVDPFQANLVAFSFFYVSLFLSLLGTGSLVSFALYKMFSRSDVPLFRFVQKSFRNACFFSVAFVILLFLQGQYLLKMWNLGLFVIVLLTCIAFAFTKDKSLRSQE